MLATVRLALARNRDVLRRLVPAAEPCVFHDLHVDQELNWSLLAFSGTQSQVYKGLREVASIAYDSIDLNRHSGYIDRVGALEVELVGGNSETTRRFCQWQWDEWAVPSVLDSKNQDSVLLLKRRGFGGALANHPIPDFGGSVHESRGVCIVYDSGFRLRLGIDVVCPSTHIPLIGKKLNEAFGTSVEHETVDLGGIGRSVVTTFDPVGASLDAIHGLLQQWRPLAGRPTLLGALRPFDLSNAQSVLWHERQVWDAQALEENGG